MSSKQTRKSISVSGELYTAIREHVAFHGNTTGSGLVEDVMRDYLEMEQRTMGRPRPPEPKDKPIEIVTTKVTTKVNPPKAKPKRVKPKASALEARRAQIEKAHKAKQAALEASGDIFTF